jgi:hypothetical protein
VRPGVSLLVASRTDTVKAKSAAASGIDVVDYPAFIALLETLGVTVVRSGEAPNTYTDLPDKPSGWVNVSKKPGSLL